jgi:hypothetical protein
MKKIEHLFPGLKRKTPRRTAHDVEKDFVTISSGGLTIVLTSSCFLNGRNAIKYIKRNMIFSQDDSYINNH